MWRAEGGTGEVERVVGGSEVVARACWMMWMGSSSLQKGRLSLWREARDQAEDEGAAW